LRLYDDADADIAFRFFRLFFSYIYLFKMFIDYVLGWVGRDAINRVCTVCACVDTDADVAFRLSYSYIYLFKMFIDYVLGWVGRDAINRVCTGR
jgi:hypothetical protein